MLSVASLSLSAFPAQSDLLSHLQQRINGSVLVALLRIHHAADHLLIQVREHVAQGPQVLLTVGGTVGGADRHPDGHHTLVINTWHT